MTLVLNMIIGNDAGTAFLIEKGLDWTRFHELDSTQRLSSSICRFSRFIV